MLTPNVSRFVYPKSNLFALSEIRINKALKGIETVHVLTVFVLASTLISNVSLHIKYIQLLLSKQHLNII